MNVITWDDLLGVYPEFVRWAETKIGPLPEGPITKDALAELIELFKSEQ